LTRLAAVVEQRIARKREGTVSPEAVARPLTTDK
ncbi:amino acid ABC transporter permease, partial [Pseudomonas syringae pv. actinidiae]|nr:amino acid ABC transporter permease [Pseudomonas syringae pv. actinidiae]NVL31975.1 amino acid ABC transporter permease [Pseudomonas syringae pv. actinidiae]